MIELLREVVTAPSELQLSEADLIRFYDKFVRLGPDDCWLWRGGSNSGGYGSFRAAGKNMRAHRIAFQLHHRLLLPGEQACHSCDVRYSFRDITYRRCVNPAHIWAGTNDDNVKDRDEKGRVQHGDRHYAAKLTGQQVSTMRRRFMSGEATQAALGIEYGMHQSYISRIVNCKRWKHIAP